MAEITSTIAGGGSRLIHIRRARLTVTSGEGAGTSWQVDRDLIRIGARADNEVTLTDSTVSRLHAEIVRGQQGTILRDLQSTNGTFVGAVRIRARARLRPPDAQGDRDEHSGDRDARSHASRKANAIWRFSATNGFGSQRGRPA